MWTSERNMSESEDSFTVASCMLNSKNEKEKAERGKEGKTTINKARNETHCRCFPKTMNEKFSRASVDSVPSKSLESEKRHGSSKNKEVCAGISRMSAETNYGERYTRCRPHTAEPDYNIRAQIRQYRQHHPTASTPGLSQTRSLSSPCGQFGPLSESTY